MGSGKVIGETPVLRVWHRHSCLKIVKHRQECLCYTLLMGRMPVPRTDFSNTLIRGGHHPPLQQRV